MKSRRNWYISLVFIAALGFGLVFQGAFQSALAGGSWFSKKRQVTPIPTGFAATRAAGDIGTTVFDMVISLYNDPSGDDDPDNDTGTEEQTDYEEIIRFWTDAIYEQSNGVFRLGKVRIFRNGRYGALADVVWNASEGPRAAPSGFGVSGKHITFGDIFPNGSCSPAGCVDFNYLTAHEEGGYTLGHEFGHYVLGLYDEYQGKVATSATIYWPLSGDTPVQDSIMNSQWNAITATGYDFRWLNHSTSDNYEANTGQGRAYGASGWEVMVREVGDDPKDGDRSTLNQRVRYTALVGEEPTAADNWMVLELPGEQNLARNELEIIWMQDDIEMQIVIDRSFSMNGDPFDNAKEAAKTLVDEVEDGSTALGVVSFDEVVKQDQPIVSIPDPPGTVKDDIKTLIDNLAIGNNTAVFDAAKVALDNLISYATTKGTNAAQLVFLLSDGVDTAPSTETQASVTAAYQAADVPLSTFAYGSFAPEGVLRELAEDTGGLFRTSPTDLAEIQSAFLATKAALTSSAAILQESASVDSNGSNAFSFAVDSTLRELSIFANYLGSSGDVSFSLAGQNGAVVGVSFACTEVSAATSCSAAVSQAAITSGGIGGWTLTAKNNTSSSVDVNVDILATPLPVRTFDLVVASLGGTEVTYPNPILLTATPSQGAPITEVNISAAITDPSGTVAPLTLVDTGENGDGIAGDGTYSAILDYEMNGTYLIRVMVDNAGQTAQFTLEGEAPGLAAATDGTMPNLPALPPITQNFTRTASMQLVVSGVVSDDHPNSHPGTSVSPNNGDVPGRIEVAGDVDVFTIPTTGLDYVVFRVTGLAFGMEPRLRILAADGSEIFSATVVDLVVSASYLALNIPVDANAQLHAEVSHATGGTGSYQFSAGKAIASDPRPMADAGQDQTVECTSPSGAPVKLDGTGSSDAKGEPPLSYLWSNSFGTASGATPTIQVPLGTETIMLVVNDGQLDSDPDTVDITVEDTTAPVIEALVASPSMLWPPNHKLVDVVLTPTVTDVCDPTFTCSIADIVSSEPENGLGDGDKFPDWEITGDLTAKLRAERSGTGTGRVYTIFVECIDKFGNMSTGDVTVMVPHEKTAR